MMSRWSLGVDAAASLRCGATTALSETPPPGARWSEQELAEWMFAGDWLSSRMISRAVPYASMLIRASGGRVRARPRHRRHVLKLEGVEAVLGLEGDGSEEWIQPQRAGGPFFAPVDAT